MHTKTSQRLSSTTADWVWPSDGSSVCPGNSVIYDPDGKEVARSYEGREHLLIFDIDSDLLVTDKGKRVYGSGLLAKHLKT